MIKILSIILLLVISTTGISQDKISTNFTDKLSFQPGWKWLSFSRLQRYGNEYAPSIPVLERLNCFPCPIDMHFENPDYNIKYFPVSGEWEGDL